MCMVYGYSRVSTVKQAVRGNSLEDQTKALQDAGAEKIFSDAYTGTKMDRPAFTALMNVIRPGDKLIVTKLDRLARTAVDGGTIVRDLHEKGVVIQILNMGVADNTPMGKLMVTMLLAFAEFERDMIVERTQTGRQIAKANGTMKDGRPRKFNRDQRQHALELLKGGLGYRRVESMTGISKSTLVRLRREQRIAETGI